MTKRLIGNSQYTLNYEQVVQSLRHEAGQPTCFCLKRKGLTEATALLELLEGMEERTRRVEDRIKATLESIANAAALVEDPLSRLARAHNLRAAGDSKGCWRLLEMADTRFFGDLERHIGAVDGCVKEVEELENAVQEGTRTTSELRVGNNGTTLQQTVQRTIDYAMSNFELKQAATTSLTQKLMTIRSELSALNAQLLEIKRMPKADVAEFVAKFGTFKKSQDLRTAALTIATRRMK